MGNAVSMAERISRACRARFFTRQVNKEAVMADKPGQDLVVTGREAQQVGTHQMYLVKGQYGEAHCQSVPPRPEMLRTRSCDCFRSCWRRPCPSVGCSLKRAGECCAS